MHNNNANNSNIDNNYNNVITTTYDNIHNIIIGHLVGEREHHPPPHHGEAVRASKQILALFYPLK